MPSTDRLLWLLQMALFLGIPAIYLVVILMAPVSEVPLDCGSWIYTDAAGKEYTVQLDEVGQRRCESGDGTLANLLVVLTAWITSAGLGAILFCLRRIGRAMGAD